MKKKIIIAASILALGYTAKAQYDRPVVSLTKLNYVYYNIDNPMSVSVPGLLPKDLIVSIGEDKAYIHKDPDGSNSNDLLVKPKDSTGTITVHVDEKIGPNQRKNRGMIQFRVITLPNPTIYLYVHRNEDSISINKLLKETYIPIRARYEDLNFDLDDCEILSFELNTSQSFNLPISIEGNRLTLEAIELLRKARLDETITLENIKVKLPDERIITLKAEFPIK